MKEVKYIILQGFSVRPDGILIDYLLTYIDGSKDHSTRCLFADNSQLEESLKVKSFKNYFLSLNSEKQSILITRFISEPPEKTLRRIIRSIEGDSKFESWYKREMEYRKRVSKQ
jgi:hypothetical protein